MPLTIRRFLKRPAIIEAAQFVYPVDPTEADGAAARALAVWCDGRCWLSAEDPRIVISTSGGPREIRPGDWIARGLRGEFFPISDAILRETTDPA